MICLRMYWGTEAIYPLYKKVHTSVCPKHALPMGAGKSLLLRISVSCQHLGNDMGCLSWWSYIPLKSTIASLKIAGLTYVPLLISSGATHAHLPVEVWTFSDPLFAAIMGWSPNSAIRWGQEYGGNEKFCHTLLVQKSPITWIGNCGRGLWWWGIWKPGKNST